jgi:hypothetical protein
MSPWAEKIHGEQASTCNPAIDVSFDIGEQTVEARLSMQRVVAFIGGACKCTKM